MNLRDFKKPPVASRTSQAIRCIHCGAQQNFASGGTAVLCRSCSTRITLVGTRKDISETPKVRPQSTTHQREGMQRHSKKRPVLQGPALLAELHALEKRLSRVGAFIPFLGPWLIRWNDLKTVQERKQAQAALLHRRRCGTESSADCCSSALRSSGRTSRGRHSRPRRHHRGVSRPYGSLSRPGGVGSNARPRRPTLPRSVGSALCLHRAQRSRHDRHLWSRCSGGRRR